MHKAAVSHILSYVKVTSYSRTLIIKYFEDYQRFFINVVTSVVKLFLQTYHHHLISRHRRFSEKGEIESYLWRINQVKQNPKNNLITKWVPLIFMLVCLVHIRILDVKQACILCHVVHNYTDIGYI